MDKRSLLARLVKAHPAIQSLITGEQTKQDSSLLVSWDSLERRRVEYQELVQKKIPANSKEIAIARSYGDLRENHEFKAAKEMQKVLMRQKQELEAQLMRARGTDFSNTKTDAVAIGSIVLATDLGTNQPETFTILGAWDSDPDKGIISYLSPVGAALLNHKPGEEVEFEFHGAKHRHRIEKIEAWKAPAAASPQRLCQLKHRFPPCPPCNLRNWHLRFKRHRRFDVAAPRRRAALFKSPKKKFGGLPTAATTASFFAGD